MFLEHRFSLLGTICAEQKSCFHHSWAVQTGVQPVEVHSLPSYDISY